LGGLLPLPVRHARRPAPASGIALLSPRRQRSARWRADAKVGCGTLTSTTRSFKAPGSRRPPGTPLPRIRCGSSGVRTHRRTPALRSTPLRSAPAAHDRWDSARSATAWIPDLEKRGSAASCRAHECMSAPRGWAA